jgi:mRNA interferase RelE/StbE
MRLRVTVQWTETARKSLRSLPRKVRQGLIAKIDGLKNCDPREAHKPLLGPLQGCRSIKYSRYRAIYRTETQELVSGAVLVQVKVQIILTGIRKERDKKDVYEVAKRLVELGIISSKKIGDDESKAD